jgi:hypothetical protein
MAYLFRRDLDAVKIKGVGRTIPVVLEARKITLLPGNVADLDWRVLLPVEEGQPETELTSGTLAIEVSPQLLGAIEQSLMAKLPEFQAALEQRTP